MKRVPKIFFLCLIVGISIYFIVLRNDNLSVTYPELSDEVISPVLHESTAQNLIYECSFFAPYAAITLEVDVVKSNQDRSETVLNGGISIGIDRKPINQLKGTIIVNVTNEEFQISVSCGGGVATYDIPLDTENLDWDQNIYVMEDTKAIIINNKIPIVSVGYNETVPESYSYSVILNFTTEEL